MNIITENLSKYARVFEKVRSPKVAYYGSVYLDFEKEKCYFYNDHSLATLDLILEEKNSDYENIYVFDGDKFFLLIDSYDKIHYDGACFYSPDGNKFKLNIFNEPFDSGFQFNLEDDEWKYTKLIINNDFLFHLKNSIHYASTTEEVYKGVFFRNEKLVAIQRVKFYLANLEQFLEKEFVLPLSFVNILLSFDCLGDSDLYINPYGDAYRIVFKQNDFSFFFTTSSELELPVDIESDQFKQGFEHESYIIINKKQFQEALKFLEPFAKDIIYSRIKIKFDPNEDRLTIFVDDDSNQIEYHVPILDFSDKQTFEDESFLFSLTTLSNILFHLDSDNVVINYCKNAPTIKFSSGSEATYFIVHTKIEEE